MPVPAHAELHVHTSFSFLDGASAPADLVERALELGLSALAVTDRQGLYGVVRFASAAAEAGLHPVIGVEVELVDALVADPHGLVVPARRPVARGRPAARAPAGDPRPRGGLPARPQPARAPVSPATASRSRRTTGASGGGAWPASRPPGPRRDGLPEPLPARLPGEPRRNEGGAPRHAGPPRGPRGGARRALGVPARRAGPAAPGRRSRGSPGGRGGVRADLRRARRAAGAGRAERGGSRVRPGAIPPPPPGRRLARRRDCPPRPRARPPGRRHERRSLRPARGSRAARRSHRDPPRANRGDAGRAADPERRALPEVGRRSLPRCRRATRRRDPATAAAWREGLVTAGELAAACRVDLGFEQYRFPGFPVPPGETAFSYLAELCHDGIRRRYHPVTPPVVKQLAHELDVIERTGLAEFFLICWDLMRFARERRIPAQGRGSAADSIVAYVLGITRVDPIRHNLLFERFINEGRTTYPDVDIDFSSERREEVIQYVYERYGPEHTGMVCNLVTYRARSAVREVGLRARLPAAARRPGGEGARDVRLGDGPARPRGRRRLRRVLPAAGRGAAAREPGAAWAAPASPARPRAPAIAAWSTGWASSTTPGAAGSGPGAPARPATAGCARPEDAARLRGVPGRRRAGLPEEAAARGTASPAGDWLRACDPGRWSLATTRVAQGTPRPASPGWCEAARRRRPRHAPAVGHTFGPGAGPPRDAAAALRARSTAGRARRGIGRPGPAGAERGPARAAASLRSARSAGRTAERPAARRAPTGSSVARLEPEPPPAPRGGSTVGISPWERWLELCARIDGFPRHLSIHTGGMLVTAAPLVDIAPLERATMPGRVVVQFDKRDVETLKLIKLDLLGLGMLAAIDETLQLIEHDGAVCVDLDRLPEEIPEVFAMLQAADTVGVFQVESRAQMQTLPKSRPACLDDLVVEVAIIRPGPIQGNAVHPYLRRKQGLEPVAYLHPSLEPVLRDSLGVILYQEQVMRIAIEVAGFSPAESDGFRRAMGTWRSPAEMEKLHARFVDGCVAVQGMPRDRRRGALPAGRRVRQLRVRQEPRGGLRPDRLRVGLPQALLPGPVPRRARQRPADGLLPRGGARQRREAPRGRRPAGRRQRLGLPDDDRVGRPPGLGACRRRRRRREPRPRPGRAAPAGPGDRRPAPSGPLAGLRDPGPCRAGSAGPRRAPSAGGCGWGSTS